MKTIKILMIQVDGPIDIYGRFSHTFLGRLDLETAVLNSLILVFCVWALINTYKYLTVKCGITTEWLVNYLITMPQLNDLWKFIQCKIYGRFRHSRTKFMFAWAIQSIASGIFCCCHCSCRQIALHYASALNVELHDLADGTCIYDQLRLVPTNVTLDQSSKASKIINFVWNDSANFVVQKSIIVYPSLRDWLNVYAMCEFY